MPKRTACRSHQKSFRQILHRGIDAFHRGSHENLQLVQIFCTYIDPPSPPPGGGRAFLRPTRGNAPGVLFTCVVADTSPAP